MREIIRPDHVKTGNDFKRWLAKNPEAGRKRRVHAFNAIADSNYREAKKSKPSPTKAKPKKAVSKRI